MVEYEDGSVIAQMSYPSMELPIALALCPEQRLKSRVKSLDFGALKSLTFTELDREKYPCFDLVVNAGKTGGCIPAVANVANEIAVKLFLENKISFNDIYKAIYGAVSSYNEKCDCTFDCYQNADTYARNFVKELFKV